MSKEMRKEKSESSAMAIDKIFKTDREEKKGCLAKRLTAAFNASLFGFHVFSLYGMYIQITIPRNTYFEIKNS